MIQPLNEPAGLPKIDAENPWPGLESFTEDANEMFHGREEETAELFRLVRRETLTVLYGQSGLGKSSLLQAGLFPLLRKVDFVPLYIRLDYAPGSPALAEQVKGMLSKTSGTPEDAPPLPKPGETLWAYLHRKEVTFWTARHRLATPVLVFDQFEELFTLGRTDAAAIERSNAFVEELACLIENRPPASVDEQLSMGPEASARYAFEEPRCKIVLALREDFLPELDDLEGQIRSIRLNRMRIRRMSGLQALEVISRPAPHLIDEAVALQIVDFVAASKVRARSAASNREFLSELEVEPALLSVVCRELNGKRQSLRYAKITADLLTGNRREILTDFYERSVAGLPADVRAFVEDRLLTHSGFRDSVAVDSAVTDPGISRAVLDQLVARRLLRIEDRQGVERVELTHDVLIEPVRASRDSRQQREALARAAQREEEARAKLADSRRRTMVAILAILLFLCVPLTVWAVYARVLSMKLADRASQKALEASTERERAMKQAGIAEDERLRADREREKAQGEREKAQEATTNARTILASFYTKVMQDEVGRNHPIVARLLLEKGVRESNLLHANLIRTLMPPAMFWAEKVVSLKDLPLRPIVPDVAKNERAPDEPKSSSVKQLAWSADGSTLAVLTSAELQNVWLVNEKGRAELWTDPRDSKNDPPSAISYVAFSPAGSVLALRTADGVIILWDTSTKKQLRRLQVPPPEKSAVTGASGEKPKTETAPSLPILFASDGQSYFAAREDGSIARLPTSVAAPTEYPRTHLPARDVKPGGSATSKPVRVERKVDQADLSSLPARAAIALAFVNEGQTLASCHAGEVFLWDSADLTLRDTTRGHGESFGIRNPADADLPHAMAVSPAGRSILVAPWYLDNQAIRFGCTGSTLLAGEHIYPLAASSAAFSVDGAILGIGSTDEVRICREDGQLLEALRQKGAIKSIAFRPDGLGLATGSDDGTVKLWAIDRNAAKQVLPPARDSIVAVSADGSSVAALGRALIVLYDSKTGVETRALRPPSGRVMALAYHGDEVLALIATAHEIGVWGSIRQAIGRPAAIETQDLSDCQFDGAGDRFVARFKDGTIQAYDAMAGVALARLSLPVPATQPALITTQPAQSAATAPSTTSPTATAPATAPAATGPAATEPADVSANPPGPTPFAFNHGGTVVALFDAAASVVRFYDPVSGKEVGKPLECGSDVKILAFNGNDQVLLIGANSGALSALDVRSRHKVFTRPASAGDVLSCIAANDTDDVLVFQSAGLHVVRCVNPEVEEEELVRAGGTRLDAENLELLPLLGDEERQLLTSVPSHGVDSSLVPYWALQRQSQRGLQQLDADPLQVPDAKEVARALAPLISWARRHPGARLPEFARLQREIESVQPLPVQSPELEAMVRMAQAADLGPAEKIGILTTVVDGLAENSALKPLARFELASAMATRASKLKWPDNADARRNELMKQIVALLVKAREHGFVDWNLAEGEFDAVGADVPPEAVSIAGLIDRCKTALEEQTPTADETCAKLAGIILQRDPRNFDAMLDLGFVQYRQHHLAEADRIFRNAALLATVDELHDHCKILLDRFETESDIPALALAQILVKRNPSQYLPWGDLGVAQYRAKQYDDAIESYQRAMTATDATATNNGRMLAEIAWAWNQKGDEYRSKAAETIAKALLTAPGNYYVFSKKGELLEGWGELQSAARAYSRALQIDPEQYWPRQHRIFAYRDAGMFESALHACDERIDANADDMWAVAEKGVIQRLRGYPREAVALFDQAIASKYRHGWVYSARATALLELGERDKAIADAKEAARIDAAEVSDSGIMLRNAGDLAGARQLLEELARKPVSDETPFVSLGILELQCNNEPAARRNFEAKLQMPATTLDDRAVRTISLAWLGRADEAIQSVDTITKEQTSQKSNADLRSEVYSILSARVAGAPPSWRDIAIFSAGELVVRRDATSWFVWDSSLIYRSLKQDPAYPLLLSAMKSPSDRPERYYLLSRFFAQLAGRFASAPQQRQEHDQSVEWMLQCLHKARSLHLPNFAATVAAGRDFESFRSDERFHIATAPVPATQPTFTNSLAMSFTRIEPGVFIMGSPTGETGRSNGETQHKVRLTRTFFLGTHLVTRGQFAAFVKETGYVTDAEQEGTGKIWKNVDITEVAGASWKTPGFEQTDAHPVVMVSWNDAMAFCQWLSSKEEKTYRLATEAEWEYACRAGTQTAYFWGDDPDGGRGFINCADLTAKEKFPALDDVFNWADGYVFTSPVGSFKPNAWGLHDMIGNCLEWCSDYAADYPAGDATDPTGPLHGNDKSSHVLRGGAWSFGTPSCRCARHFWEGPGGRYNLVGFRVACDAP